MITIEIVTGPVFIKDEAGVERALGPGTWQIGSVTNASYGTNAGVAVEATDGDVVLVDMAGLVSVHQGPSVALMATWGFAVGMGVVGMVAGLRWAFRAALTMGRIEGGDN